MLAGVRAKDLWDLRNDIIEGSLGFLVASYISQSGCHGSLSPEPPTGINQKQTNKKSPNKIKQKLQKTTNQT